MSIPVTFRLARMDELGYVRESLSHPDNKDIPREEIVRSIEQRFQAQKSLLDYIEGNPALLERYLVALANEFYGLDAEETTEAVLQEAITAGGLDGLFEVPDGFLFFGEKVELLNQAGRDGIWDIDAGEWGRWREAELDRQFKERWSSIEGFLKQ